MKSLSLFWIFGILIKICLCIGTETSLHNLEACRRRNQSCKKESKNVICSCDRVCVYYDNCCFDAEIIKENGISEEDHLQKYHKMTTCITTAYRKHAPLTQGAFMISSCPVAWNSDVDTRQACELYTETDVRDMLPVVDTSTNLTFKNRHCAECHRIQNYTPWLLEIECEQERLHPSPSITEVVMAKLHSDHCSYRFIPPNAVTVHYCYQEFDYKIISNSSETDNISTCRNRVFSPILVAEPTHVRYFRTLQCLIANEGPGYTDVLIKTYCVSYFPENEHTLTITLSYLIDFSALIRKRVTKCEDDEIQLSDEIGCRRFYCPSSSEPADGECIDIKHTSNGFILDLLFEANKYFENDLSVTRSIWVVLNTLMTDFGNYTGSRINCNYLYLNTNNTIPGLNSEDQCSVIRIYLYAKGLTLTRDTLDSGRSWVARYFNNYTKRFTDGSTIRHIANIDDISCMTNVSFRNPLYLQEMISVDNDLPCPAVKLQYSGNESDSEGETKNVSLSYFHLQGISISPLDVVFANGDHFVCIDTFSSKYRLTYQQYDTMDSYRSIINTACASISIICMLFCLIQYCVIPMLKSDLLIVLLLFLLLAQTCFFILSHFEIPSYVCEWVGIIHHFTWLGAFVFMFLCPYRLNAEIRDLQNYSKTERMKTTVKFVLVGVSLPLFFIICIKITNVILTPAEKWYGGSLCFITQTYVLLFGFVVPVFLILCGNAFLLICIIQYMTSTSIAANSNKSNVLVFIKISTIMGFSWIIGIIAILFRSDVLLLIFEVLSNLQGTFITISFSCTNRVKALYKACFQQIKCKSSARHATS